MLSLLPTPLGNLGDISLHTLSVIKDAEVFLCEDTRVSRGLFSLLLKRGYFDALNLAQLGDKASISGIYLDEDGRDLAKVDLAKIDSTNLIKIDKTQTHSTKAHPTNLIQTHPTQTDLVKIDSTHPTKMDLAPTKPALAKEASYLPPLLERPFISLHSHNEKEFIDNKLGNLLARYKNIAYLSDAGMPAISDPGAALVAYAQRYGIEYEVLAGGSAHCVAYAASGFAESRFLFAGFLTPKEEAREEALRGLLCAARTSHAPLILYEAPTRILAMAETLCKIDATLEVFFIKEISKRHETRYKGRIASVLKKLREARLSGEWVIVVRAGKEEAPTLTLGLRQLLGLDLPPKAKSKLISKLIDVKASRIYDILIDDLSEEKKYATLQEAALTAGIKGAN